MGTVVRQRSLRLMWVVPALALCAAASGACGQKVLAKTPDRPVALTTPAPPDRVLTPVSIDPTPTPVPVETPVPVVPTRPTGGRGTPPPPTPTPTTTPTPDPPAPPVLQTSSSPADLQKRASARLLWAETSLKNVSRDTLSKDAQAQYDSAESFVLLDRTAMTAKNFIYAHFCADKAATLLSLLVK